MPWLDKGKVLFIHIPRCGGTSITKFHRVDYKARQGKNCYYKFGIIYYYYRYGLLEHANFPLLTYENGIVFLQVLIATFLYFFGAPGLPAPYIMWTLSSVMFIMSTFILTAPYTMRYRSLRVLTMYTFHYLLCGFGGDANYMVGTNINGYLFHLTAERALRYGYVSPEEMEETSFSIVRNPYSRVVSMYHYNRRFYESFHHFVKDFHARCMEKYHLHRQTDSIDVYCHVLPMHAYTHFNGKKLVNTIIKQEDLKRFVANGWKDSGVPIAIQKALTGIPHANKRPRKISWQKYYTQEIMDMVIDMYEKDFELFGYSKLIPTRPDLRPSKIIVETPELQELSDPTEIPVLPQPQVGLEAVEHPQNGSETDHYFLQKKDHDNVQYPLKDDAGLGVKAKAKKQRKAKVGSAGAIYEEQPMAEQNELRQT